MSCRCRGFEDDLQTPKDRHGLAHIKQQIGSATVSMLPQEGADLEIDPDP